MGFGQSRGRLLIKSLIRRVKRSIGIGISPSIRCVLVCTSGKDLMSKESMETVSTHSPTIVLVLLLLFERCNSHLLFRD